ncbi:uncharacterized protein ARMOST_19312 [Armillaria ostoyae]|uniref:Uncharacterized protein n=1 Tax=Armillaria ostoyae TaxID=47428 RepID=A0A284S498_ARMOS|nr:uncharacterized protein ARMOST_19312 [Armillaria ostoyae]
MSTSPPSSPVQSALARAQKRRYQTSKELSSPTPPPAQSTSRQRKYPQLAMSSDSPTPAPSAETLFGDFRVLEQECQKLEKRAVRAGVLEKECQKLKKRAVQAEQKAHKTEESLNLLMVMYRRAQFEGRKTEDSFNQLMHMHRRALARLDDAQESKDGLRVDLVKELRCGICNKDLDGAYSLACGDTFHGTCLWQWFEVTV